MSSNKVNKEDWLNEALVKLDSMKPAEFKEFIERNVSKKSKRTSEKEDKLNLGL